MLWVWCIAIDIQLVDARIQRQQNTSHTGKAQPNGGKENDGKQEDATKSDAKRDSSMDSTATG